MLLRLSTTLLLLAATLTPVLARPQPILLRRDADFDSVRTHLKKDRSGKRGDPQDKYFHESVFDPHYDGRFAFSKLPVTDKHAALTRLMQTYLAAMNDIGLTTWIMHGTLLGWWWNAKIFPWDSDVDVQVTRGGMDYLAQYYNMTIHSFVFPKETKESRLREFGDTMAMGRWGGGVAERVNESPFAPAPEPVPSPPDEKDKFKREGEVPLKDDGTAEKEKEYHYLLEINPHYSNDSWLDRLNVIDARWIDTDTGLYIDITTLRVNNTAVDEGKPGSMMCKDRHHYMYDDIFPLRDSVFEGAPVKVPFAYAPLLVEEYGEKSLTDTSFLNYKWNEMDGEWKVVAGAPTRGRPGFGGRRGGHFRVDN